MSAIIYPPAPLSRQQEKAELSELNDRMQNYLGKVKKIREQANKVDSSALLNSIRVLEDEVSSLKNMYDMELNSLRRQLEDTTTLKNNAETQAQRNGALATDLQDRLSVEHHRNKALDGEIDNLQRLCAQRDMDFQQAKGKAEELGRRVRDLEDDLGAAQRKSEDTLRGLDRETVARQEAQDARHNLQKKLDFQEQLHNEQTIEWRNRLEDEANRILQLEGKVRELSRPDNTLQEVLAQVRAAAAAELQKYKEQSEATFHRNIQQLKNKIDTDATEMEYMNNENKRLGTKLEEQQCDLTRLNNQLTAAESANRNLRDTVSIEREKTSAHIRNLEDKLRDMQEALVEKMREITKATDAKQPMRVELEALKGMLLEEERKLANIPGPLILPARPVTLPSPPLHHRPATVDPSASYIRSTSPRSARPASVPVLSTMGQGKDYFDAMFGDLTQRKTIGPIIKARTGPPSPTPISHDYTTATSSAVSSLKILEINEDGKFVRLFNASGNEDVEVGGFLIQQNIGGHPVAVFRFPPRTRFRPGSVITVWAASSRAHHNPPTDFLWREQHKWGTGPECTSILCKPNGQAIAWTTAAHRFTKTAQCYDGDTDSSAGHDILDLEYEGGASNPHPQFEVEIDGKPATVLKREKQEPPSLSPAKHPHGNYSGEAAHPSTRQPRVLTNGNDNSSTCRQTRSQNSKPVPDPVPGELYSGSGAPGSRMGSAALRKSAPSSASSSRGGGSIRYSSQPSPFASPHQQYHSQLGQLDGGQKVSFKPPMPRPPVISSW
ncbi:prelamin-A/C [Strongylocentrotus purpuratus]|uniref:LTD domain-containing protein n=1 Tax=Strongylocentrotus purpuratus TaxID=7668 RepID=A0A7M7P3K1_STRPU|nr:prelamin-A/C [Strongylocentrotus purpuratus]